MRILISVLIILLLTLNYSLWRSDGQGIRELRALDVAIRAERAQNAELEERNKALEAEVQSLKEGIEAIEERARVELGMIRDGETFFRILEEHQPAADRSAPVTNEDP